MGYLRQRGSPCPRFIQSDGSIHPISRPYLVENNRGQLLTRAETLSLGKTKSQSSCAYIFIVSNRIGEVTSFRRRYYTPDIPSSRWELPSGYSGRSIGSPRRYTSAKPR